MDRRIKRWWNGRAADRLLAGPSGDWIRVRRALEQAQAVVPPRVTNAPKPTRPAAAD